MTSRPFTRAGKRPAPTGRRARRQQPFSGGILEPFDLDFKKSGIGVAFDVGTTTVAGASLDLGTGRVLGQTSLANPQSRWGRDVISRLAALDRDPSLLMEMSASLTGACNSILRWLTRDGAVPELTAAGHPAREHLVLGG